MPFHKIQRIITLIARLSFFALLFFSFRASDLPRLPFLSSSGTAAFLALVLIVPLGHASSFWFMTVANLSAISLTCAAVNLIFSATSFYDRWRNYTFGGFLPFVLCLLYLIYGTAKAKYIFRTRYTLRTDHLLPSHRLRIVHLADIHPHRLETRRETARLYRMIDEENPDIIMLTGDIFDENTTPEIFGRYLELFAALHPKYGIFFVFGNHDASHHWKTPSHTKDDILEKFPKSGIRILEDETEITADGLVSVIGRRTREEERLSPAELLGGRAEHDSYRILLCHEPVELDKCAEEGADLILAGHTHGGQIFPLGFLTNRVLRLHDGNSGLIGLGGGKNAVITSGVGTWSYPVRTEGRSEIVVIDVYSE